MRNWLWIVGLVLGAAASYTLSRVRQRHRMPGQKLSRAGSAVWTLCIWTLVGICILLLRTTNNYVVAIVIGLAISMPVLAVMVARQYAKYRKGAHDHHRPDPAARHEH